MINSETTTMIAMDRFIEKIVVKKNFNNCLNNKNYEIWPVFKLEKSVFFKR